MSQQRVLKALENLGLTLDEAKVYIFLAEEGPQAREYLMQVLKLDELQLHRSLESLRILGVINSTFERSVLFYALPFEKALELLVNKHLREAEDVEQNKKEIIAGWRAMAKTSSK